MVLDGVGVHGDKQRGAMFARDLHPLFQRDESVLLSGHRHTVLPGMLEQAFEGQSGGEGDVFFVGAGYTDGAGILSAMARIEHHERRVAGRPARCGIGKIVRFLTTPGGRQKGAEDADGGADPAQHEPTT